MLELEQIAELRVDADEPAAPPHVATASGIVARGEYVFVVADDRPMLGVFEGIGATGTVVALEGGALPDAYAERKAAKPDLESLAALPGSSAWPHGALLTLGSGSTERRERGWLVPLAADGAPTEPLEVSLSELYGRLRQELPDLNIEGVAAHDGALWLAQRGNGAEGFNAIVELDLDVVAAGLASDGGVAAAALRGFSRWTLGEIQGVRLTFSDLSPAAGTLLFCAVAEDVESTYLDGECVGAGIGALDPRSGDIAWFARLREPHKVEGITPDDAKPRKRSPALLLVADPDADDVPAPLFSVPSENLPA